MVLPPIEGTPTVVMRFTAQAPPQLITLAAQRLREGGGLVVLSQTTLPATGATLLVLTTSQERLEAQAERLHFMKRSNISSSRNDGQQASVVDYFTVARRRAFVRSSQQQHDGCDADGLFTAQDRAFLTTRLLKQVTVVDDTDSTTTTTTNNALAQLLETAYQAKYRKPGHLTDSHNNNTSDDTTTRRMQEHGAQSETLWHVLTSLDWVDTVCAVHQPDLRDRVVAETTIAPWRQLAPPVDLIHDYFGYEVGYYFAWMGFLTRWYRFPGYLGLAVYLFRLYRGDGIDTDEFTPLYGLVCFLWAVLLLRFWEREENRLALRWGTYSLSPWERQKFFATRPEFYGFWRVSPITGESETYYPPLRRRLKFVASAVVTLLMLGIAFSVMILSLNLQGYINPKHNTDRWNAQNRHPFHFPTLTLLAEEGHFFDSQSLWRSLLPVILHVACISTLNSIYRGIAEWLTTWENHETEVDHSNSLVLKRFLFEAFDCYVALFYLAFYERDVDRLRFELVSVFQIDTLRRVLLECGVPMLVQSYKLGHFVLPTPRQSMNHQPATLAEIVEDLDKDDYDQFDDYMEIVIQLGYVTLFASAFPLASLLAILANWVEIRSDAFKMGRLLRRPDIHRAAGLGMWRTLMASVIWMSALTNCLIAGFTSDQLQFYLPSFYSATSSGYNELGQAKGWVLVFVIFGLERLLLVAGLLVYAIVPAVPEDVQDALERRQFLRLQRIHREDRQGRVKME